MSLLGSLPGWLVVRRGIGRLGVLRVRRCRSRRRLVPLPWWRRSLILRTWLLIPYLPCSSLFRRRLCRIGRPLIIRLAIVAWLVVGRGLRRLWWCLWRLLVLSRLGLRVVLMKNPRLIMVRRNVFCVGRRTYELRRMENCYLVDVRLCRCCSYFDVVAWVVVYSPVVG